PNTSCTRSVTSRAGADVGSVTVIGPATLVTGVLSSDADGVSVIGPKCRRDRPPWPDEAMTSTRTAIPSQTGQWRRLRLQSVRAVTTMAAPSTTSTEASTVSSDRLTTPDAEPNQARPTRTSSRLISVEPSRRWRTGGGGGGAGLATGG